MAVLRKLSEHCNYGETLPEMLRDWLVCGINIEKMQRRLLAEAIDATPSNVYQVHSAARNKGKNPQFQIQNAIVEARNTKLPPVDLKIHSALSVKTEVI